MKFCREGNCRDVFRDMRNRNHHPVRIKPGEDNPLKKVWTNEVPIQWEFAIKYLAKDGMVESSKGVEDLFAYVFHGKYAYTRTRKDKDGHKEKKTILKPIIHALHFHLTAHRSRFTTNVDHHFQEFFRLLDTNTDWEKYLDDLGAGEPPRIYLIAVEKGTRSCAFDKRNSKMTMGLGPTRKITRGCTG